MLAGVQQQSSQQQQNIDSFFYARLCQAKKELVIKFVVEASTYCTSEQVVTMIKLAEVPRVASLRHVHVEDVGDELIFEDDLECVHVEPTFVAGAI